MPLSRRYVPEHPAGETCTFGMDFSNVVPPGEIVVGGSLAINENVVPPVPSTDWTVGTVTVLGRVLYATLSGGIDGTDYQLVWTAIDGSGNIWPRVGLVLCAATS